jgi:hypothetical protein
MSDIMPAADRSDKAEPAGGGAAGVGAQMAGRRPESKPKESENG